MSGAPPGWYRDPVGTVDLRWWSGGQWTEHLMPWSAVAPAFWAQSVHAAGNAEERLSAWAVRAVCLYVASQALRDLLPPGHATRPLVLRTWLCYVFTVPAVLASELTALAWLDVGVAIGIVAILGWILVGAYRYRVVKAVSMDHRSEERRVG